VHLITIASLFPNAEQPRHGIFVEERLWHLRQACDFRFHVIAPVPWFPAGSPRFGEYGRLARVPREEERRGLLVHHPRFLTIPKLGTSVQPFLYASAVAPHLRRLVQHLAGPVLLDGQYLYPDGVATALLAKWLGLPFVLTARGSDVNVYPRFRIPNQLITWACSRATRVITVSSALQARLLALGIRSDQVVTLRNGVDLERFRPMDRDHARHATGLSGNAILAVGNLVPVKDHELLIRAIAVAPELNLTIIGEGPLKKHLQHVIGQCKVEDRVQIRGNTAQQDLITYYSAADVCAHTSRHEGMPNVVLESMACGTPVVATECEGIPELLTSPAAGTTVRERTPTAVAQAIRHLLATPPRRDDTRQHATTFGWGPTVKGLRDVLTHAASASRAGYGHPQ
jgi:glycosyltransferase involved in cell wall biosynthesis